MKIETTKQMGYSVIADNPDILISKDLQDDFKRMIESIFEMERNRIAEVSKFYKGEFVIYNLLVHNLKLMYYQIEFELIQMSECYLIKSFNRITKTNFNKYFENADNSHQQLITQIILGTKSKLETLAINQQTNSCDNIMIKGITNNHLTLLNNQLNLIFENEPKIITKYILSSHDFNYQIIKRGNIFDQVNRVIDVSRGHFQIGIEALSLLKKTIAEERFDFIYLDLIHLWLDKFSRLKDQLFDILKNQYSEKQIIFKFPDLENILKINDLKETGDLILETNNIHRMFNLIADYLVLIRQNFAAERVKLVAPCLYTNGEFELFKSIVNQEENYSSGIIINSLLTIERADHYQKFDFVVIEYDSIYEEIVEKNDYDFLNFKKLYKRHLSYVHHLIYRKRRRDIAYMGQITDPKIFKKMINGGYRQFIIKSEELESLESEIDQHIKTRGRYKKN